MYHCDIYVQHPVFAINQTYTYRSIDALVKGQRVLIPFGAQEVVGLVHAVRNAEAAEENIKDVIRIIDERPLLNEELYELASWLETNTIAPYMACIQAMLPTLLKPKKQKQESGKKLKYVRINAKDTAPLTPKQLQAYLYVSEQPGLLYADFRKLFGVAKKLVDLGYAEVYEKEAAASWDSISQDQPKPLKAEQKQAVDAILQAKSFQPFLLHGVTGSGKTEVYLQCASEVIRQGKQVILLVPEIALTSQMVERVKQRFRNKVAIYHSRLNNQERYEQYQLVLTKQVSIAVGTRSAIFLPFTDLGLIIVDEEHDKSYKQESSPRYHVKDIAMERGRYHQCPVVLASATPSLEAYARAMKQVYTLLELKQRVNETVPECIIVDMREEQRNHHFKKISRVLYQEMQRALARKEQVILLMNRRGYAPVLRCRHCKEVIQCPHCDVALSYHKDSERLKCHLCDYEQPYHSVCNHCQHTDFEWLGYGIQRLEEELHEDFPSARVLRMDRDTTSKKHAHDTIIKAFAKQEADILIGTQMIAKGLDFDQVTCVGVMNADVGLYRSDFRATEDTFQLITQACGRSGRAEKAGKVFIQSFDVEHYALQMAKRNDYRSFFQTEMKYRHMGNYPPYCYLASILITHEADEIATTGAFEVKAQLKLWLADQDCKVYGPSDLIKTKDLYRKRILLKSKDAAILKKTLYECMVHYKQKQRVRWQLEIDLHPSTLE